MLRLLLGGICAAALMSAATIGGADLRLAGAAERGDRDAVRSLIAEKANVNAAQGDGMTALHWAAFHDDTEAVRILLQAGASVKAVTRVGGITPLYMAAVNGNAAIVGALLEHGADANAATSTGATALMTAATSGSVDAVRQLLDHGANVNARETAHGQTALMFAAAENRPDAIKLLASRGADSKVTTPVVKLEKPKVDEDGNPIVERAPSSTPPTPEAAAAAARRVTATVTGGMTALLLAARDGRIEAVRALLDAGADINQVNAGDKSSPIVIAICNGHFDVAKFLLDRGADPNVASVDGLAALYAAIDTQWAPMGWAPNPITAGEKTSYLDLMAALLDHGANPNARLTRQLWFRPTHHSQMWIGSTGATPFWRAAQATDLRAMRLLAAHGTDPKIPSAEGDTPLMVAAGLGWAGNFSKNAPDSALDAARYCLELGLDVNTKDVQGYTALAGAAYRGENELVALLVERGARLDARTSRGWSVTDMANGPSLRTSVPLAHPDTIALLRKLGAPELTAVEGEEILGIIKRRPSDPAAAAGTADSKAVQK